MPVAWLSRCSLTIDSEVTCPLEEVLGKAEEVVRKKMGPSAGWQCLPCLPLTESLFPYLSFVIRGSMWGLNENDVQENLLALDAKLLKLYRRIGEGGKAEREELTASWRG